MEEKTQINDIDRSIYDIKDEEKDAYRIQAGLTPEIVEKISREKHDPAWMELFRLQSFNRRAPVRHFHFVVNLKRLQSGPKFHRILKIPLNGWESPRQSVNHWLV